MPIHLPTFATCALVSGVLGIHPTTLQRWIAAGKLPRPTVLGPRHRGWDRAEIEPVIVSILAARE